MLILANREAEYFFPDDWTGFCAACPSGKSPLAPFLFELKALGKASGRGWGHSSSTPHPLIAEPFD
jgi:hypothetical protein